MSYKVFVSTDYDKEEFCVDSKEQANLLYRMAINSRMFSYVSQHVINEQPCFMREWVEEENTDDT